MPIHNEFFSSNSGNVEESLKQIRKFLQRKQYVCLFIEEGLRFSSSLYLMLIWMRVFQWVLDKPDKVIEEMASNLPNFKNFYKPPSTDHYIEGLIESLKSMGTLSIPSPSGPKRRLADIHDSTESEDEPARKKTKKSKKSKKRLHFDEN